MAHCYQVEGDGSLLYIGDDPDNCPGYVFVTAAEYPAVTYWAELAQTFEPGSEEFNDLIGYVTAALLAAWVCRVIVRRIAPKL